jgi:hypothetical protein
MAAEVALCTGSPPCLQFDYNTNPVEMCKFPVMKFKDMPTGDAACDPELVFCRKISNPNVNMTVRGRDGTDRNMQPNERELMYCNRWFNRLRKRARTVKAPDTQMNECQACLNCDKKVYLSNAHLRETSNGLHFETNCQHFACMSCILKSAFRNRGFGQKPSCMFCRTEYDEDDLVAICIQPES